MRRNSVTVVMDLYYEAKLWENLLYRRGRRPGLKGRKSPTNSPRWFRTSANRISQRGIVADGCWLVGKDLRIHITSHPSLVMSFLASMQRDGELRVAVVLKQESSTNLSVQPLGGG